MKLAIFCLVSFIAAVYCQDYDCSLVDCAIDIQCPASSCGRVFDGCCPTCCSEDIGCALCFADPCEHYVCADNENYVCEANYCGGCGRDWFTPDGFHVACNNEVDTEVLPEDWDLSCQVDNDCSLQNEDLNFACCWEGVCDEVDYERNRWDPVNTEWWTIRHDQCSTDCGPAPGCSVRVEGTEWQAHCIANVCTKVNTRGSSFTSDSSSDFTSVSSNSSSSNTSDDDDSSSSNSSFSNSNSSNTSDDDDDNSSSSNTSNSSSSNTSNSSSSNTSDDDDSSSSNSSSSNTSSSNTSSSNDDDDSSSSSSSNNNDDDDDSNSSASTLFLSVAALLSVLAF